MKDRIPPSITLKNGDRYVTVVARVENKDDMGRPRTLTFHYDDDVIRLANGDEFLVLFVKDDCVAPKAKADA